MVRMNDTKLIEALSNARASNCSSSAASLTDCWLTLDASSPYATISILASQCASWDWRTGQMRLGKIVAIRDDQVTVHEEGTRSQWKLSYAAIDPGADSDRVESESPTINIQPSPQKPGRDDFRRGDKVSFTDKYLQHQVGTITRINQRTASVECEAGTDWRVPFALLSHVMDI